MLSHDELSKRYSELIKEESSLESRQLWLSFCDTDKPKGDQFLGVIVIESCGLATAIQKLWEMGINPGGQVLCYETSGVLPDHMGRLLSKDQLRSYGYIE